MPENILSIYDWSWGEVNILKLKNWVEKQIELGNTEIGLDIEWGYYHDISDLTLIASTKNGFIGELYKNKHGHII